ncbi:translation initiation factor IF-2-like [Tachysurus ichikawai]
MWWLGGIDPHLHPEHKITINSQLSRSRNYGDTYHLRQKSNSRVNEKRATHTHNQPRDKLPSTSGTQNPNYQKFSNLVKKIFELLRSYHHHHKTQWDHNTQPITLLRLTNYLTGVIKPAKITPLTKTLIEGNAKNWAYTTQLILQDHYTQCIAQEVEELAKKIVLKEWEPAFDIAVRWYKNRFGKRHLTEAIEEVKTRLLTLANKTHRAPEPVEGAPQVEEAVEINLSPPPTQNWHSPPSDLNTPPPPSNPQSPTTLPPPPEPQPPTPLPQRTPKQPRDSLQTPKPHTPNPVVVDPDDIPDLFTIHTFSATEVTVETSTPRVTRPPKDIAQDMTTHMVMVHPEVPNPQLNQLAQGSPQTDATGDTTVDDLICITDQEVENSSLPMPQLTPIRTVPTPPRVFRATRHLSTLRKVSNWSLTVRKKWCIIGDSNLSKIPPHGLEDLQIDSYPGATFRHAEAFIAKAIMHTEVEAIILSFGINHRAQKQQETAIKQLQRAVRATKVRFPHTAIWIPLINHSQDLKKEEIAALTELNAHIKRNMPYLPLLPDTRFQVSEDGIHWTASCAKAMLDHWCQHLNLKAL